jgi:hypothetical protein
VALECAASLVSELASENAISFLAWWKGEQYLTFYPIEVVRQYRREDSQEIISDYVHKAVINHQVTVEVRHGSLAIPVWRERSATDIWKMGDPLPQLCRHLNVGWMSSLRHPDPHYSQAVVKWCGKMLPVAARKEVTLMQIPPASVKLKYRHRDAILRMAFFPEVREMVACEM